MFCNKCGKEITSGYLCEECQLETVKTPSKNVKLCKKCGKEIEDSADNYIGDLCVECRREKARTLPKNVKLCKRCGKEIGSIANYCGICQREIDKKKNASKSTSTGAKFCKNCGASISQSAVYCPYCNKFANINTRSPVVYQDEGSFGAGWALGFLLGLVGLIIALCVGKDETKRGAKWGFIIYIVITVVALIFYGCVVASTMKAGGGYRYY